MFCYQENFASPTKPVDSRQFWALVRAPRWRENIARLRQLKLEAATLTAAQVAEVQPPDDQVQKEAEQQAKQLLRQADQLKRQLPAFIFQATFDETPSKKGYKGCWRKQSATQLTGLVVMDIDHVDNPREAAASWLTKEAPSLPDLCLRLGILLVYVTPSGHGLKVVFKARTEWGNLIDNQHQMARLLDVEVDEACKDASRMSFICTESDILFINNELFTYENKEFAEKFNNEYRGGHSRPTLLFADGPALAGDSAAGRAADEAGRPDETADEAGAASGGVVTTYHGVDYQQIVEAWLGGTEPAEGDRHNTLLKLATDLRYICDNNARRIRQVLEALPWVAALVKEGENLDQLIKSAQDYKYYQTVPRRMREALLKAGAAPAAAPTPDGSTAGQPPLAEWGRQIDRLAQSFPGMQACLHGVSVESYPAALFTAAAFLGTCMTRCWYHFYHRPEEERRLNYCIYIIGDPASGKSFAGRLYRLLAAPLIAADKVSNEAINRYKREMKERGTSSKEQKKEALRKPDVIVRIHGTRTANGVFIEDMNRAVDQVGQRELHLHLLTFDAELDASTAAAKGGQWINKETMELKAFHNEEDNQQYMNQDSVSGPFNVYWNYIYTGTPLSLQRKVTEHNFGSGLSTRLACIPFPPSNFEMLDLRRQTVVDHDADEQLKQWAFRLDSEASGELPLWPLVEQCWEWSRDHMQIAAINDDHADELLLKRVPYYGIAISAPFIMMRHWEEWKQTKKFEIDETDRQLCELVLNIQYRCQHWFFGQYARAYFDNQRRDNITRRQRSTKYKMAFEELPAEFTLTDVEKHFGCSRRTASVVVSRLRKDGAVSQLDDKNKYKKNSLSI